MSNQNCNSLFTGVEFSWLYFIWILKCNAEVKHMAIGFLFILSPLAGFMQEPTKTIKEVDGSLIKEYTVLKSNKKIKHGLYTKKQDEKILEKGFFKDNRKDSTWVTFYSNGKDTMHVGTYLQNQPVDIWDFYEKKNKLKYCFDFGSKQLVRYNWYEESNLFRVFPDSAYTFELVDSPPIIPGCVKPMEMIAPIIKYPVEAIQKRIQGVVIVSFIIDEAGKMNDVKVGKKVAPLLDAEALRVVQLTKDKWYPAIKNGKPVKVEYALPINFKSLGIIN